MLFQTLNVSERGAGLRESIMPNFVSNRPVDKGYAVEIVVALSTTRAVKSVSRRLYLLEELKVG